MTDIPEEALREFAQKYFEKIDNIPSDAWAILPIRVKEEHLEKMRKILAVAIPIITSQAQEDERKRICKWVEDHSTFEGRGAGTMTMKVMKWWWQALKEGRDPSQEGKEEKFDWQHANINQDCRVARDDLPSSGRLERPRR